METKKNIPDDQCCPTCGRKNLTGEAQLRANRRYMKRNPEKMKEINQRYYKNNKEKIKEKQREYYQSRKEMLKKRREEKKLKELLEDLEKRNLVKILKNPDTPEPQ